MHDVALLGKGLLFKRETTKNEVFSRVWKTQLWTLKTQL